MLIDELCNEVLPLAAGHTVADVRIGLGYTGVLLDDSRCGLAYTFREGTAPGCCVVKEAGSLSGRPAAELAERAHSRSLIEAAVGLATLNALIKPPLASGGDVLDLLSVAPMDTVGMVGYFGPLVEPLQNKARTLHIFEQREETQPGVLPEVSAKALLPQCQVVIISATALLNRTLDDLLERCQGAREVALLGPSTPLLPGVLGPRGVTILSGIEVANPLQALRIISEGGGTREMGKAIRKISLRTKA